jgi:Delta3-Delta2-enoyl-CoA isomerase
MPRRVKQFIVKSISTTTILSDSLQDWGREFEGGKKLTETKYLFDDDVLTIQMNRPEKLNGWTLKMMSEINELFKKAAAEPKVKVLILTGVGEYYCAGVNLSAVMKPMSPKTLHGLIREQNKALFDMFLDFPKPIIAAVNGPAIGASVTSATLCDAIICTEHASFSTPFYKLGVPPEGCSSIHFPRIFGKENADRMMGKEGFIPNANEALELGFVHSIVPTDEGYDGLLKASNDLARTWIKQGKAREIGPLKGGTDIKEEFKSVNVVESQELADCFFREEFLEGQRSFLASRGKSQPALMFSILKWTRPIWKHMLP